MSYEQITVEVDRQVATLTLNRPERRNAWTRAMGIEMRDALPGRSTRTTTCAPSWSPAPGRDFCVGADLEGGGTVFDEARAADGEGAERLSLKAWDVRKPVIAALNGAVAGVGATLPLQWDIRLAGESTRITFVFVKRGLVPEAASTWLLPRLDRHEPRGRAAAHRTAGRRARGTRHGAGVARRARRRAGARRAQALAREIAEQTAPVAVALTKRLLWHMTGEPDPAAAEKLDAQVFGWATQSPDAQGRHPRVPREAAGALER